MVRKRHSRFFHLWDSTNGDADRKVAYIKAADTKTGQWVFVKEQGV